MAKDAHVTIRVKIGQIELEVSGPREYVDRKIEEFLQRSQGVTAAPLSGGVEGIETSPNTSDARDPRLPEKKKVSIAQLFLKMTPKSDVDRALIAGYFLETFQGIPSFTASEIKDAIKSARVPPPRNPSDVLSKNVKKGFIMPAGDKDGKLAYMLTTDGETQIQEMATKNT